MSCSVAVSVLRMGTPFHGAHAHVCVVHQGLCGGACCFLVGFTPGLIHASAWRPPHVGAGMPKLPAHVGLLLPGVHNCKQNKRRRKHGPSMEQHTFVSQSHSSARQQDDEGRATPHRCKASSRRGGPCRTCGVACQRRCRAVRQHARVRLQSPLYRDALLWPMTPHCFACAPPPLKGRGNI